MMTLRELIENWESTSNSPLTDKEYAVKLPLSDAAKLAALAEMYPSRNVEQIITELLSAALNELEQVLPYVEGEKISSFDELGDPIYEDAGPTRTFVNLTRKYLNDNQQH